MPNQAAENSNKAQRVLIFFDMDGVLTDFEGHAQQQDKLTADGKLKYSELDYNWWVTMPAYPEARALYDEGCRLGEARFLTGPALHKDSYSGKATWIQDFVPERGHLILEDLIICRSEEKYLVARPGRILVDDRLRNIQEWEEAGGIGIHHTGDYKDTLKRLHEAVAKLEVASNPAPAKKRAISAGSRGPRLC